MGYLLVTSSSATLLLWSVAIIYRRVYYNDITKSYVANPQYQC